MGVGVYDVKYKVLLLGDAGVGKTALMRKLMGQELQMNYMCTIGIDYVSKIFDIDGAKVQLEIWDTAGQERFRSITRFQYRGTKGLLLVYDVTNVDTFTMLNYWLDSIDREIDYGQKEPIPVLIIGNKCDLTHMRKVSTAQGKRLADENLVFGFLETSALTSLNVDSAFWQLAKACAEVYDPKLMDSYLKPDEKKEKYEKIDEMQKKEEEEKEAKKKRTRGHKAKAFISNTIKLHKKRKDPKEVRKSTEEIDMVVCEEKNKKHHKLKFPKYKDHRCLIL